MPVEVSDRLPAVDAGTALVVPGHMLRMLLQEAGGPSHAGRRALLAGAGLLCQNPPPD